MSRRGLTLLELLIALTVLASIVSGVGVFWAQARAWEVDNARHREILRVDRVLGAVRSQWSARRVLDVGDDGGDAGRVRGFVFGPDTVEFATAEALLSPGWGLVTARYSIERGVSGGFDLVYEEARVTDVSSPASPGTARTDPRGRALGGREVVIAGAEALYFERWGTVDGRAPTGALGGDEDDEDETDEEEIPEAWRPYVRGVEGDVNAVRLVGEIDGEVFSCVLVGARLR